MTLYIEPNEDGYGRAMVVFAHPDDAEWGSSGTASKLVADKWDVTYVVCTDGSKGTANRDITSEQLSKIRHKEQINAGKIIGLKDVVFLDYPDGYLEPSLNLRKDIAREIRKHKPGILICPYPMRSLDGPYQGSGHPDHIAAGEATLSAVFPSARDYLTFPDLLQEGLEPWAVKEVWIVGHPSPDLFIDISSEFEKSVSALLAHKSQMSMTNDEVRQHLIKWKGATQQNDSDFRFKGRAHGQGMKFAESFKRLRY
ncbi:MAG: N-acetylglucosaminyl deacetylase, LmbE family [Chloroflexi bacterium]|jgi:LmbE family N-acetylglucosaminyl deacetylase|nr:MAG: N-acetylglucosaminyl deacetylase, LmbE family [Chloroflexota bacterium]